MPLSDGAAGSRAPKIGQHLDAAVRLLGIAHPRYCGTNPRRSVFSVQTRESVNWRR